MDQHDEIGALAAQVRAALARGDQPAARRRFGALQEILEPHVAWEEAGLFARMTAQGDFAEHVESLEAEHAALHAALAATAAEASGWGEAVVELLDGLGRHIYRENFGLFPGAVAVLDADDWAAIDGARPNTAR